MSDTAKDIYDKASILKDIDTRMQIIRNYQLTGQLDRDKAVEEIQKLRLNDEDVATVTAARLAVSATPFSQVADQGIIAELQMQVDILTAKLSKN